MAKSKKEVEQEIKDLASVAEIAFKNISENIKDVFSDALSKGEKVINSITKDMQRNINSLAKDSNKLIINQSRINQGLFTAKDITKQILENEDKLYVLEQQRASTIQAINDDAIKSEEEKKDLINEINKEYNQAVDYNTILVEKLKEQESELTKVEKKIGITGKLFSGLNRIPLIGDVLNINKGLSNMRTKAQESDSTFKILGSGIKGAFEGIEKASVILGLVAAAKKVFDFIKDAMFAASERTTQLAKNLMLGKDEARAIYNNLKSSKLEIDSIYNTTKDVTEAYTELTNLTEFSVMANKEMVETQIILTKNLGLSKEEAFGVQEAFAANNLEATKGKDIVYDQIAAFARQNKLVTTGKQIFSDIAKTSKLIQINFNGNLGTLVKTTLEAKKLGLSLDQVSKIGNSLLNFEQSISSELEAELLTGKDLNLEKARLYALNHDIAGLTQEISKQGITQEKFAAMNVLQQEAIAGALGMSAEEMADMLYKQKVINTVAGDRIKKLRQEADLAERSGRIQDAINLSNKAAALEQGILSGKSFEEAEKATSAQDNFNQALEQAKEIFSDFIDGGYLEKLAQSLKSLADSLSGGVTGALTGTNRERAEARRGVRQYEEAKTNLSGNLKAELEKSVAENTSFWNMLGQQTVNMIAHPITSLFETNIEKQTKAREQLTAEAYADFQKSHPDVQINAKDYVIKTLPQDTVVSAGGTNLGRTDEIVSLLSQILHKEGYVAINSSKFGTGYSLGTFKVQ